MGNLVQRFADPGGAGQRAGRRCSREGAGVGTGAQRGTLLLADRVRVVTHATDTADQ
jgi:hypothetical protein